MTAQTTTTVDEAFWDLVLSDPELRDIAFDCLADPAEPTRPNQLPPANGDPGAAGNHDRPRPRPPDPDAPHQRPRNGPHTALGRVRSPPPPTRPKDGGDPR